MLIYFDGHFTTTCDTQGPVSVNGLIRKTVPILKICSTRLATKSLWQRNCLIPKSLTDNNSHFYAPEIEDRGAYCFCPIFHSVILLFCPPLWNFNLANNFWTVSARALIFHMYISYDKTFPWVPLFFTLWFWPWSLTHFLNFILANNFWTMSAKAFIFLMNIPSDKICLLVLNL